MEEVIKIIMKIIGFLCQGRHRSGGVPLLPARPLRPGLQAEGDLRKPPNSCQQVEALPPEVEAEQVSDITNTCIRVTSSVL
jgi:hypothetical protein